MEPLSFEVKKTTEQFLNNYSKHDLAGVVITSVLAKRGIKVVLYGEDARNQKIWAEGEDKPNAYLEYEGQKTAFIDWKGHERKDWMLNERAYYGYLNHAEKEALPMYCVWLVIPIKKVFYAKMPFKEPSRQFKEHDQNWVVVASSHEVKPFGELIKELLPQQLHMFDL